MDRVIHQLQHLHGRVLEFKRELDDMEQQLRKVLTEARQEHAQGASVPYGTRGETVPSQPRQRAAHRSYGSQYANQVVHEDASPAVSDTHAPMALDYSYSSFNFGTRGVQTSYENDANSGTGAVGRQSEYTTYGRQR